MSNCPILHKARCGCEHFAVAGLVLDVVITVLRLDVLILVITAKFAILLGGIAVILLHKEENKRAASEQEEFKQLAREVAKDAAKEEADEVLREKAA